MKILQRNTEIELQGFRSCKEFCAHDEVAFILHDPDAFLRYKIAKVLKEERHWTTRFCRYVASIITYIVWLFRKPHISVFNVPEKAEDTERDITSNKEQEHGTEN